MVTGRGAQVEVLSLAPEGAEVAAVRGGFLARYEAGHWTPTARTCAASSPWMSVHRVGVLEAARAQIELHRAWMEARGLPAATIDRRLSTVCGFRAFARIDGRIPNSPATSARRPRSPQATAGCRPVTPDAGP